MSLSGDSSVYRTRIREALAKASSPSGQAGSGKLPYLPRETYPANMPPHQIDLQIHLSETRRRTVGMTPEERAWRKRWINSQNISEYEPLNIDIAPRNPLRKIYQFPFDWLQRKYFNKWFGWYYGSGVRWVIPKVLMCLAFAEVGVYFYKYQRATWEDYRGLQIQKRDGEPIDTWDYKQKILDRVTPEEFKLAHPRPVAKDDFYDFGFKNRTVLRQD